MKKALSFVWKILKSNLSLKIMALIFAVILWSYVLYATNPVRERVLQDITVRYLHAEDLKAKNLAIVGGLSDVLGSVDIRVKVNQRDLSLFSAQGAQANVDLSEIKGTGKYALKVKATLAYGQVLDVSPSEVTLTVDRLITKQVPVTVKTVGDVPAGYYAGPPEISPNFVNITGAQADVEKVVSALCSIDLNGLTTGYSKSVDVSLLDKNDNAVPSNLFSGDFPSVMVKLNVLSIKTVAVDAQGSIIGRDSVAPGYEITGITCNPATVRIIGEKSAIDAVASIPLMPYSVSGLSSDVVVPLDYSPPEGVTVLADEKAEVTINIREIMKKRSFTDIPVRYKNLSAGLAVSLDISAVDVTVTAGESRLSKISKTDIVPYIDLDGLAAGTYTLIVQFEVPSGFTSENFSSSAAAITVTIKKK